MTRTAALTASLLAATAATAATAHARPFGEKAQYIVTSDAKLDYQRDTSELDGEPDVTRSAFAFRLAGDYSSFRRVTFGINIGFDGTAEGLDTTKGFRFGGRAGYVVPLGTSAALWLRAGLSFGNVTYQDALDQYTVRSTRVSASAPVMFTPYPQVLVGLGPTFDRDLKASAGPGQPAPKVTGFGVHLTLGFWFE